MHAAEAIERRPAVYLLLFIATLATSACAARALDASIKVINDCSGEHCPDMVIVPSSPPGFAVGSPDDEKGRLKSEKLHRVSIKSFAIGRSEISTSEYLACVKAKGCKPPEWLEPGGEHNIFSGTGVTYKSQAKYIQGDNQPIVGVSWFDASAYTEWLSQKTRHHYRLPSETEWEYAARSGSKTAFWWGNNPTKDGRVMACCRGCGSAQDALGPFPVDSFEPNAFGLYGVHGNVWEWVADYYCEDYETGPTDGSARTSKSCGRPDADAVEGLRIFRGGSCFYEPRQMRAAMRLRNWPDFRNQTLGFRIARDLSP